MSSECLPLPVPAGVRLIVSDSRDTLYDGVVDETVRGIDVGVGTLTVTLDQLEGAVGLRVRDYTHSTGVWFMGCMYNRRYSVRVACIQLGCLFLSTVWEQYATYINFPPGVLCGR